MGYLRGTLWRTGNIGDNPTLRLPPRFVENPFVWGEVGARNQDVVKARHLQDPWGLRGQGVRQHESGCKGIYMVEAYHNKAVLPLAARTV